MKREKGTWLRERNWRKASIRRKRRSWKSSVSRSASATPQGFDAVGGQLSCTAFWRHRYQQTPDCGGSTVNGSHRDVRVGADLIEQCRFGALIVKVVFQAHIRCGRESMRSRNGRRALHAVGSVSRWLPFMVNTPVPAARSWPTYPIQ